MQVTVNGAASNQATLLELASEPAGFSYLTTGMTRTSAAIALNEDQSLNSQSNPAKLGSVVTIWVNGAGLPATAVPDGTRAPFGLAPALPIGMQVSLGPSASTIYLPPMYNWIDCQQIYAAAAPGEAAGMVQIDFRLPDSAIAPGPFGEVPIQVIVGGESAISNIWLASE